MSSSKRKAVNQKTVAALNQIVNVAETIAKPVLETVELNQNQNLNQNLNVPMLIASAKMKSVTVEEMTAKRALETVRKNPYAKIMSVDALMKIAHVKDQDVKSVLALAA